MITLDTSTENGREYLKFEEDLLYKVKIGILTLSEATDIIDEWLKARGL